MNRLNERILNHRVLQKLIEMKLATKSEIRRLIMEEAGNQVWDPSPAKTKALILAFKDFADKFYADETDLAGQAGLVRNLYNALVDITSEETGKKFQAYKPSSKDPEEPRQQKIQFQEQEGETEAKKINISNFKVSFIALRRQINVMLEKGSDYKNAVAKSERGFREKLVVYVKHLKRFQKAAIDVYKDAVKLMKIFRDEPMNESMLNEFNVTSDNFMQVTAKIDTFYKRTIKFLNKIIQDSVKGLNSDENPESLNAVKLVAEKTISELRELFQFFPQLYSFHNKQVKGRTATDQSSIASGEYKKIKRLAGGVNLSFDQIQWLSDVIEVGPDSGSQAVAAIIDLAFQNLQDLSVGIFETYGEGFEGIPKDAPLPAGSDPKERKDVEDADEEQEVDQITRGGAEDDAEDRVDQLRNSVVVNSETTASGFRAQWNRVMPPPSGTTDLSSYFSFTKFLSILLSLERRTEQPLQEEASYVAIKNAIQKYSTRYKILSSNLGVDVFQIGIALFNMVKSGGKEEAIQAMKFVRDADEQYLRNSMVKLKKVNFGMTDMGPLALAKKLITMKSDFEKSAPLGNFPEEIEEIGKIIEDEADIELDDDDLDKIKNSIDSYNKEELLEDPIETIVNVATDGTELIPTPEQEEALKKRLQDFIEEMEMFRNPEVRMSREQLPMFDEYFNTTENVNFFQKVNRINSILTSGGQVSAGAVIDAVRAPLEEETIRPAGKDLDLNAVKKLQNDIKNDLDDLSKRGAEFLKDKTKVQELMKKMAEFIEIWNYGKERFRKQAKYTGTSPKKGIVIDKTFIDRGHTNWKQFTTKTDLHPDNKSRFTNRRVKAISKFVGILFYHTRIAIGKLNAYGRELNEDKSRRAKNLIDGILDDLMKPFGQFDALPYKPSVKQMLFQAMTLEELQIVKRLWSSRIRKDVDVLSRFRKRYLRTEEYKAEHAETEKIDRSKKDAETIQKAATTAVKQAMKDDPSASSEQLVDDATEKAIKDPEVQKIVPKPDEKEIENVVSQSDVFSQMATKGAAKPTDNPKLVGKTAEKYRAAFEKTNKLNIKDIKTRQAVQGLVALLISRNLAEAAAAKLPIYMTRKEYDGNWLAFLGSDISPEDLKTYLDDNAIDLVKNWLSNQKNASDLGLVLKSSIPDAALKGSGKKTADNFRSFRASTEAYQAQFALKKVKEIQDDINSGKTWTLSKKVISKIELDKEGDPLVYIKSGTNDRALYDYPDFIRMLEDGTIDEKESEADPQDSKIPQNLLDQGRKHIEKIFPEGSGFAGLSKKQLYEPLIKLWAILKMKNIIKEDLDSALKDVIRTLDTEDVKSYFNDKEIESLKKVLTMNRGKYKLEFVRSLKYSGDKSKSISKKDLEDKIQTTIIDIAPQVKPEQADETATEIMKAVGGPDAKKENVSDQVENEVGDADLNITPEQEKEIAKEVGRIIKGHFGNVALTDHQKTNVYAIDKLEGSIDYEIDKMKGDERYAADAEKINKDLIIQTLKTIFKDSGLTLREDEEPKRISFDQIKSELLDKGAIPNNKYIVRRIMRLIRKAISESGSAVKYTKRAKTKSDVDEIKQQIVDGEFTDIRRFIDLHEDYIFAISEATETAPDMVNHVTMLRKLKPLEDKARKGDMPSEKEIKRFRNELAYLIAASAKDNKLLRRSSPETMANFVGIAKSEKLLNSLKRAFKKMVDFYSQEPAPRKAASRSKSKA